jgi:N-acetyl-anhydromuramoyl-L-alanine amidase
MMSKPKRFKSFKNSKTSTTSTTSKSSKSLAPAWLDDLPRWRSPNHNARPLYSVVDTVVIHNISLPPEGFESRWVRRFFTNQLPRYQSRHPYFASVAHLRVSAHFYISRSGRVVQCVPIHRRAWHAGQSCMPTPQGPRHNLNHTSVGIELAGSDHQPFTDAQYSALQRILLRLNEILPIGYITGHSDIAPTRKTDPGPYFDWEKLQSQLPLSVTTTWVFKTAAF